MTRRDPNSTTRRRVRRAARWVGKQPGRFVEWRLTSSGWSYGCLLVAWLCLSWAVEWGLSSLTWAVATLALGPETVGAIGGRISAPWTACWWLATVALWLLLFEVGLAYVLAAAWSSHRALEIEGDPRRLRKLEQEWREAGKG